MHDLCLLLYNYIISLDLILHSSVCVTVYWCVCMRACVHVHVWVGQSSGWGFDSQSKGSRVNPQCLPLPVGSVEPGALTTIWAVIQGAG